MAAVDSTLFPLVELQPVATTDHAWAAVLVRIAEDESQVNGGLNCIFGRTGLRAAIAPLDCVLLLDSPGQLDPDLLHRLPTASTVLCLPAAALGSPVARRQAIALHDAGYRILIDGPAPEGVTVPATVRAISLDCGDGLPDPGAPGHGVALPLFGPHLARNVPNGQVRAACQTAGFTWFTGGYASHPETGGRPHDGISRKRLLSLLTLVARDADTRELEDLLKQDPALAFQLLRLVNSAAFNSAAHITTFGQAINVLGRRQLQRWLQLLLYAREDEHGDINPLLPLAALRAAHMEALCRLAGGDREQQDLAFMTGVFTLLPLLLGMRMEEIVGALSLDGQVTQALLERLGRFGPMLQLVETPVPAREQLEALGLESQQWFHTQLEALRWAVHVSRTL
jgi:EAL and modified HD-GYP domain-containing signal transduction protein